MPNIIRGASVDKNHFVGVTTLGELRAAGLRRPSSRQIDIAAEARSNDAVADSYTLRATVQRRFDKARCDRAATYARYINGLYRGTITGGTPPINIYIDGKPQISGDTMTIGHSDSLCVIDGETQTEARFILADENESVYDWPIAVVVWHGYPDDSAPRQYLVDCNAYATPIQSKTAMAMDETGRLTIAIRNAVELAGFGGRHVNTSMNAELPGKRKKFTQRQLAWAATGYAMNGTVYGRSVADVVCELNNPVPSETRYTFESDAVSANVAAIINIVLSKDLAKTMPPMVWLAAGILARQNFDVRQLNYERAVNAKPRGSVDAKLAAYKAALRSIKDMRTA